MLLALVFLVSFEPLRLMLEDLKYFLCQPKNETPAGPNSRKRKDLKRSKLVRHFEHKVNGPAGVFYKRNVVGKSYGTIIRVFGRRIKTFKI
jgi:hypothetical protein